MADKPVHTLREGAIGVAIWLRANQPIPHYEITTSRSYYSRTRESFGYTSTLRPWDLSILADLLSQARAWIEDQDPAAMEPPPSSEQNPEEPGAT